MLAVEKTPDYFSTLQSKVQEQIDSLNPQQQKAVQATEGPVLILAGAGTGKTTVLTTKLGYLMAMKNVSIGHLLAVTFTNKAANQMKERLSSLLNQPDLKAPWVGTFHHICVRILRRHYQEANLPQRFLIIDSDDQLRLLKQIIKTENLDEKKFPPRLFSWAIGRLKDRALMPAQVTPNESAKLLGNQHQADVLSRVYTLYQKALQAAGNVDFGDLILLCIDLFRRHPTLLSFYQKTFHYLLVDEYQDTNVAQYLWLRLLAGNNRNICCVGDDDQSIYGWRGAEVDHILRFEKDFPGTMVVKLEENYRSTGSILKAAALLIQNNKDRLGKTLQPASKIEGEAITLQGLSDDKTEARFIAHEINSMLQKGLPAHEMAILVRATFQTREIEERLMALGIPYRLVGSTKFYERLEIKDALAYLKVLTHPFDNLSLERVLGTPKRGIGPTTLHKLHQEARNQNLSLWQVMQQSNENPEVSSLLKDENATASLYFLSKAGKEKIKTFVADIQGWQQATKDMPPAEACEYLLEISGYKDFWVNHKAEEGRSRLENLRELTNVLQEFGSIEAFLEHAALVSDTQNASESAVNLMTLHAAKGLEFQSVFLAGWEEGIFPNPKAIEESGLKGLEEERRLAYVGLTRAKKTVTVTFSASRMLFGSWQAPLPSRFLAELSGRQINQSRHPKASHNQQRSRNQFSARQKGQVSESAIRPGDRITHQVFGEGVVKSLSGQIATVLFPDETRKVMSRFLAKKDC